MQDENYSSDYVNSADAYSIENDIGDTALPKLYMDDLKVGLVFYSSEYYVSAEEIIEFSTRYDPQSFHMDDKLAKESIFRGLAASGWHTVSITMNLLVRCLPLAHGIIGKGVENITWLRPTRPGDLLRIKAKIIDIDISPARPDRAMMSIHIFTIGHDNKIRQELLGKLLVFKGCTESKAM
ncbi:MaoC/PaaZ C-terminal domain-containing protein [Dickeya oryzae]|uniref:MaoC/PaaZ C-terminal domain-containing protein n=1 Tax=Dickeya oryzae TaxID=1240404 RepID=A0AB39IX71_9GAMM|nr:MaoC/PaaZ C-terminal domain-containing protein [Dickeya oryzae]MCA6991290.1 dehydratase [Dickeya oryzae]MCA6996463.1 dehydratase [Dickeya oryzae]